jgi:formate dehydrogenase subunit gamma
MFPPDDGVVGGGVGGGGAVAGAGGGTVGAVTATRPSPFIERFTRAERYVHWTTAILMLVLIATGMILYLPALSVAFGHRQAIALIHLYSGFGLPIPMAAGLFSRAYRADVRRLSRHSPDDRAWIRSRGWKRGRATARGLQVGKFNAGQKLNAAFMCGAILVMVGTGTLMWFPHLVSVSWRTGATFVHDWLALAIGFVVIGHLWFAFGDEQARAGMRHGKVPKWWAEDEHELWAREAADEESQTAASAGRKTR